MRDYEALERRPRGEQQEHQTDGEAPDELLELDGPGVEPLIDHHASVRRWLSPYRIDDTLKIIDRAMQSGEAQIVGVRRV
ncbi:MAG: hypothetical protein EXR52_04795 [Dehalococcoidia bacterium]|nr:hypothetical protein [Dehalococcoidia bacterium]